MSGRSFFADTNIIIEFLNGDINLYSIFDDNKIFISIITEIELLSKKNASAEELRLIKDVIVNCVVININDPDKETAARLRRNNPLKLPDAIIAATSIYMQLTLVTRDKKISALKNIEVLNPK